MVFTPPTQQDYDNATLAAFERKKLATFNHFLKIMPHIFSHVNVEIRLNQLVATQTLQQFDNAISVRLIGTRKFCSQVHCHARYPRGQACQVSTPPMVFKSGNSDVEACQSSCFNLFNGAVDEDGVAFKAPLTLYSERQKCCLWMNDIFFGIGTDDYMRTEVHTTPRVDTIGTGYDLSNQPFIDKDGNETYRFKLNKYYCDDFKLEFKGGECEQSLAEKIIGLLGSEVIYKTVQYGARDLATGTGFSEVQKVILPPITKPAPNDLKTWMAVVNKDAIFFNPDLRLSDLGITGSNSHLFFTTEFGWPGVLVEPLLLYKAPSFLNNPEIKKVDFSGGDALLPQFRYDAYGRRYTDEYEVLGTYTLLREVNKLAYDSVGPEGNDVNQSKIKEFFDAMAKLVHTKEFWSDFFITLAPGLVPLIKRLAIYSEKRFTQLTKTLVFLAQKTIFHSVVAHSGAMALKFAAAAFKFLSSTLKVVSIVGIVLDALGLVDILFIGRDLFGLANLNGQDAVDFICSQRDLDVKYEVYGYKSVEYSPAMFLQTYDLANPPSYTSMEEPLHPADNSFLLSGSKTPYSIDASLVTNKDDLSKAITWEAEYLHRLVRNSDNVAINWNEADGIEMTTFNEMIDNAFSKVPTSFIDYHNYVDDMRGRVGIITKLFTATTCLLLINNIFIHSNLLAIIAMFLAIISFSLTFIPNLMKQSLWQN